jgi:non-specific serine/threonine protein kinase
VANVGAATGPDGLIYLMGPNVQPNALSFDPPANSWTKLAPLASGHAEAAVVRGPDGLIYVIGGQFVDAGASGSVATYSTTSFTWSSAPSLNQPRSSACAVTLGNLIYVIGGLDGPPLGSVETLDPSSDAGWQVLADDLHSPRSSFGCAVGQDKRIYAIAGNVAGSDVTASVEIYDPSGDAGWTAGPSLNIARHGEGVALGPDGNIYAMGGAVPVDGGTIGVAATGSVESFNYGTSWNGGAPPLPTPVRAATAAVSPGPTGLIYLLGGYGSAGVETTTVQAYSTELSTW